VEYILEKLTLKQVLLLWQAYNRNLLRELKQRTLLQFLATAGAFGSKEAVNELKRIFGEDKNEVEYI